MAQFLGSRSERSNQESHEETKVNIQRLYRTIQEIQNPQNLYRTIQSIPYLQNAQYFVPLSRNQLQHRNNESIAIAQEIKVLQGIRNEYEEKQFDIEVYFEVKKNILRMKNKVEKFDPNQLRNIGKKALSIEQYVNQLSPEKAWDQLLALRGWHKRNWENFSEKNIDEDNEEKERNDYLLSLEQEKDILKSQVEHEGKAHENLITMDDLMESSAAVERIDDTIQAIKASLIPALEKRAQEVEIQQLLSPPQNSDFWNDFFCPITRDIIVQPAVFFGMDPESLPEIFEKESIERYFTETNSGNIQNPTTRKFTNLKSPMTRNLLNPKYLKSEYGLLRKRMQKEIIDRHYFAMERCLAIANQLIATAEPKQKEQAEKDLAKAHQLIQKAKELQEHLKNEKGYDQTELELIATNTKIETMEQFLRENAPRPKIQFFENPSAIGQAQ